MIKSTKEKGNLKGEKNKRKRKHKRRKKQPGT